MPTVASYNIMFRQGNERCNKLTYISCNCLNMNHTCWEEPEMGGFVSVRFLIPKLSCHPRIQTICKHYWLLKEEQDIGEEKSLQFQMPNSQSSTKGREKIKPLLDPDAPPISKKVAEGHSLN